MERARRPMRSLRENHGAGRRLDACRRRRMVAVRVGHKNVRHSFAAHRIEQRRDVVVVERAGIDDGDMSAADDVGERPLERERARIVGKQPPHAWDDFLHHARCKVERLIEGNIVAHG